MKLNDFDLFYHGYFKFVIQLVNIFPKKRGKQLHTAKLLSQNILGIHKS